MEVNGTIFVQIFIFLTILLWLSPTLFAPILRLFDERERRIKGARDEAAQMDRLALEKSQTFDAEYEKARSSAREVLTELKRKADQEQYLAIQKVREQAKLKLEKANKEIAKEETSARNELQDASSAIANQIVSSLLGGKA